MAMDALENNHNKPPLTPSSPFFNYSLLRKGNFELNIPEAFSLAKISQLVQEQLHQDVDLSGNLDLLGVCNIQRPSGSPHRDMQNKASKITKKICGDRASAIKQKKLLSRTGSWRKQERGKSAIRTKIASKYGLGEETLAKKVSTMNAPKEMMNIPSFANLFSEDEDPSVCADDHPFYQGLTGYVNEFGEDDRFDELSDTDESVGRNLGRKSIKSRPNFLDEPFEVYDYDASLFTAQNVNMDCIRHSQMSMKLTKKLKRNPSELTFESFNIFGSFPESIKKDSFDLALEQTTTNTSYSQLESKLIDSPTFGL